MTAQLKKQKKAFHLPFRFWYGLHVTIVCILLTLTLGSIFLLKFSQNSFSENPRDWEGFFSVLISFLILIATILIAYYVKKASDNNSSQPLKYKAYLDFMEATFKINEFFSYDFNNNTELSTLIEKLVSFKKVFIQFQIKNGFLFGVKYLNQSDKQIAALSEIIQKGQAALKDEKTKIILSLAQRNQIESLYASIISSLQHSLVGYYINIRK